MSYNKVVLHGRLTAAPELRVTQSGKKVATFTVAVNRDSSSAETDFIPCVAWEKKAEFVEGYFGKGQEILLDGSLNSRSYSDKEGKHRTAYEVIVNKIDFCGKKVRDTERYEPQQQTFEDLGNDGGELPF